MRVLIIIVTYNAVRWTQKCLSSIDMARYDVIVVDNASSDETCAIIREEYPQVHLVESNENLGFGRANNIGLRYAIEQGYDYVFLFNQDAWLLPDTIEKLVVQQQSHPEYWIISPLQMHPSTNGIERQFAVYLRNEGIEQSSEGLHSIDFTNAAAWLLPIKCVKTIGGFDPIFPHYGEDNDYVNRVHARGKKVGVLMNAKMYHDCKITESAERMNYRLGLGYIGLLKDNAHCYLYNISNCLRLVMRKTMRGLLNGDKELYVMHWEGWRQAWRNREDIKKHREISKQVGAFL